MAGRRANGEGSLYQRKDGRWVGSLTLDYGRRKHLFGKTRQEASKKLNVALKARQDGLPLPSDQTTVARYFADWLASVRPSVRPRTYEAYDLNVRRVMPYIGRCRLTQLTPMQVQSCYSSLLGGGLSKRSVEQVHTVLHNALRQAVRMGLVVRNVTDAVNVPRPVRQEMRTLTPEQTEALFASTAVDRNAALWRLLLTTGVRLGEALGLKWEDLDLETGRATIQRALQRQLGVGLVLVEPKTARSRRTVNLTKQTVAALIEHRRRQVEDRLVAGPMWLDHSVVFARPNGRPLEPSGVSTALHNALKRAGLPRVRVHDLRHSAATLLMQRGVHPRVVQEMLGHSTVVLTLDTYSHVTPTLRREAADQMEALFG